MDLASLRREYTHSGLQEADLAACPFQQFKLWFDAVIEAKLVEPTAMTLSTVDPQTLQPSSRIVLLKEVDDRGFSFFTNYQSRKGSELTHNARASILFYWAEFERQIRIEGKVEFVEREKSIAYFHSRPHLSQLGALLSEQSQMIADRKVLETRMAELQAQYPEGTEVPVPEHWGGYRLVPTEFEFWQGRPSRVHDRLIYRLQADDQWQIARLAP